VIRHDRGFRSLDPPSEQTTTWSFTVKLRYKILNGVLGVIAIGIAALMITVSHDSACSPAPAPAAGAEAMQAVTLHCYGVPRAVQLAQVAKPRPADGQILIRVRASSVNPAEWYGISGQPYVVRLAAGIGAPKDSRAGFDVAGVVEAVGPNVTRFKPGDEVFGGAWGAYAQYAIGREQGGIVLKPTELSFEEAAAIPIAAITALQGLRDQGRLAAGKKVLINGASGGVGTYAVQIAKAFGAEVTGVCSTRNVELVRGLGADHVVDYTRENFTKSAARYDIILDNVGSQDFADMADVMAPGGVIVVVGGSKKGPFLGPIKRIAWSKLAQPFIEPRIRFYLARVNKDDLELLANLVREGKLRPVIDRRYPLEQAAAALAYLGEGHARGKVVITVD
jgi:NADPH:quinone reductase-like Zn-dependent oxidoreductase